MVELTVEVLSPSAKDLPLSVSKVKPSVLSLGINQMTGDQSQFSVHHRTASNYSC